MNSVSFNFYAHLTCFYLRCCNPAVASQHPRFDPRFNQGHLSVWMFSQCRHGFSPTVQEHADKVKQLLLITNRCKCQCSFAMDWLGWIRWIDRGKACTPPCT